MDGSRFKWDQPHPQFQQRMKAARVAELKLEIATLELALVCAHQFGHSISFRECSVCGSSERTSREENEEMLKNFKSKLVELERVTRSSADEEEFDPLIRGGKYDR